MNHRLDVSQDAFLYPHVFHEFFLDMSLARLLPISNIVTCTCRLFIVNFSLKSRTEFTGELRICFPAQSLDIMDVLRGTYNPVSRKQNTMNFNVIILPNNDALLPASIK